MPLIRFGDSDTHTLRLPKEMLAGLIRDLPDGMLVVDEKGIIRFLNRAARALLGGARPVRAGDPFGLPVLGSDYAPVRVLGTRGEDRYVEMRVSETSWDEAPAHLVALRDVTESVEARRAAAVEAERRRAMEEIVNHSPALVVRMRTEDRWPVEYISDNVARLGYAPDDFLSGRLGFADIIHADDLERVRKDTARHMRGDVADVGSRYRVIAKDGGTLWFADHTILRRDADGNPVAYEGAVIDVTEEQSVRERLRQQEEIMDDVHDAVVVTDLDDNVVQWSDGAERLSGFTASETRGRHVSLFFAPEDRHLLEDRILGPLRRLDRNQTSVAEVRIRHRSGEPRWVHLILSKRYDGEGNHIGSVGYAMDVTELHRTRDQLRSRLLEIVGTLARAIEARDRYTAGHQRRATELAVAIATELGWEDERILGLRMGGLVHDVGNIAIPAEILARPGPVSWEEMDLIRTHAQSGCDLLRSVDLPWPVADMILQHHERLDGSGYPQGLRGDAIIPEPRILAVADVVAAMTAHRPFRAAYPLDDALAEVENGRGVLYDADAVDACLRVMRGGTFEWPIDPGEAE